MPSFFPYTLLQAVPNMTISTLHDTLLIVGIAIFAICICYLMKIPTIIGILLTGVIAGPYISDKSAVNVVADIGVVFLLFNSGIQFSIKELMRIKKVVFLGGAMQVVLTTVIVVLILYLFKFSLATSIVVGFMVSMTSTAILVKVLQERLEMDTPQARACLGISIFQDVMSIPMVLAIPILGNADTDFWGFLFLFLGKSIIVISSVMFSALWLVPKVLYYVARTKDRALFMMSILFICLAIAWITSSVGLSLALGAFLAGLIISESEYGNRALSSILPFQDLFMSFFFVSIGMLLDITYFKENIWLILLITFIALLLKTIAAKIAVLIVGYPLRTAILSGIILNQIGEFSFVLCKEAAQPNYKLLDNNLYQMFLGVSILSMMANPFLVTLGPKITDLVAKITKKIGQKIPDTQSLPEDLADHLIIVGFGLNGRNLAQTATAAKVPFVIIEMNPKTVHQERAKNMPIFFGDSTEDIVLDHANIKKARTMVIAISDSEAARRTTELARRMNPSLHIITRTRYSSEIPRLLKLGASEVIPEEFETSIEIFIRVLRQYLIPKDKIEQLVQEIRSSGYEMLRSLSDVFPENNIKLPNLDITNISVDKAAFITYKSLSTIGLRKKYSITVLAIQRKEGYILNPDGETVILPDDIVFIMGTSDKIRESISLFRDKL